VRFFKRDFPGLVPYSQNLLIPKIFYLCSPSSLLLKKMLKIGLTGNIGSGKTTVAKVFELLGIPVFYADDEAKKVMVTDTILIDALKQTFGAASYFEDGSLNRKHIAGYSF